MIAMQYSFTLPADYDMSIIDRRIAEKGHFMNGFPGLVFKAYCSARKMRAQPPHAENLYAPFYLWNSCEAMNTFLCGPGFAGLSQAFGWPAVKTWSVLHAEIGADIASACFATRELVRIAPYTGLDELRRSETQRASEDVAQRDALVAVAGFDPLDWNMVRFRLWAAQPPDEGFLEDRLSYRVGHVSTA